MASVLKRQPAGLYANAAPPPVEYHTAYSGVFVHVPWARFESSPGVFDFAWLDAQIKRVTDAGYTDVRIRPFCGASSPDWIFEKFGRVAVRDAYQSAYQDIPRWWDTGFPLYYDLFVRAIASRLNEACIEVSAAMCMSVFAECFNRNLSDGASVENMTTAGYTFAKDHAAMMAMVQIHAARLGRTRTGLAMNPWGNAQTRKLDVQATIDFLTWARSIMGRKLIAENNSLDSAANTAPVYAEMYTAIQAAGRPIAFQSRANDRLKDPAGMIDHAIALGATAVETERTPPFTAADAFIYGQRLKSRVRATRTGG